MSRNRCDRCELIIGEGCSCDGIPVRTIPPPEILISPHGFAHLPGACVHFPSSEVFTKEWGRVVSPEPGVWQRISRDTPLRAGAGNLERSAATRCSDCARAHPGYA